jgi:hypothetical protein
MPLVQAACFFSGRMFSSSYPCPTVRPGAAAPEFRISLFPYPTLKFSSIYAPHERQCLDVRLVNRFCFRFIPPKEKGEAVLRRSWKVMNVTRTPLLISPVFEIPFHRSPGPPPGYDHLSRMSKIPQRPCIDTGHQSQALKQ